MTPLRPDRELRSRIVGNSTALPGDYWCMGQICGRVTWSRRVVVLGVVTAVVIGLAGPASAHVTLHSSEAVEGGSDAVIQIRVPNEEDTATTSGLEVDFPAATPLIGLYVEPTPGWQFQITTSNLPKPVTTDDGTVTSYVSKVVWSGGTIPVGGYQDFNIDVSTMPSAPTLEVKALQTYSNGDIVRWIDDPAPAGQPDPAHPAPTLALAPAADQGSTATPTTAPTTVPAGGGSGGSATTTPAGVSLQGLARTSAVNGARTVSIIALVLGLLALLAAGAAWATRRRGTRP